MRQLRRKSDLPAPPKGFGSLAAVDNKTNLTPKNNQQRRLSQLSAIDDDVSYGFTSDEEEGEIEQAASRERKGTLGRKVPNNF